MLTKSSEDIIKSISSLSSIHYLTNILKYYTVPTEEADYYDIGYIQHCPDMFIVMLIAVLLVIAVRIVLKAWLLIISSIKASYCSSTSDTASTLGTASTSDTALCQRKAGEEAATQAYLKKHAKLCPRCNTAVLKDFGTCSRVVCEYTSSPIWVQWLIHS